MIFLRLTVAIGVFAGHAVAWNHTTPEGLHLALARNRYTLVAFVASDHEASKALLPEWTALQNNFSTATSIDCTAAPDLCSMMDVASFPAVRLYHGEQTMARYRGPRTAASIASFFRRRQQPAVTRLSGSELTPFSTGDDFVFVAHFQHSNDALSDRFTAIAEVYRDRYTFGYLGDQGQEANSIRCFNNIDGLQYVETSLTRIGAIDRFVETCTEPLIPPLTRKSEAKHTQTGKSLVHYFTNDKSDRDLYVEKMRPLAKTYQEYLTFVTVDVTEYQDMPRAMGLKSDKGLVVENTRNGQVFPFRGSSGPINAEDIETFITAISRGKIPSWTGQDKSPGSLGTEEARDEL